MICQRTTSSWPQVPLMSRNNDTARNVHIGANVVSTGLFLWQVGQPPHNVCQSTIASLL